MKNECSTTSTTAMPKRSREEVDRLIHENIPLVHWVINRYAPHRLTESEREEAFSAAMIGLWDAVEQYDPALGYRFSTLAVSRIRGRISGWLVTEKRKKRRIDREALSLDFPVHHGEQDNKKTLGDTIADPRSEFEDRIIAGMEAERLLTRCSGREKRILECIADGLTLQEVGELENGVSRERVFQIKERAMRKIRRAVY